MADSPTPPTPPTPPTAEPIHYAPPPTGQKTGMAVAALIFGLLGFCIPGAGIIGIILAIVAMRRIKREPQVYGGQGIAVAGLIVGLVSFLIIVVWALLLSILLPSLSRARTIAKRTVAASQLSGVGQALRIYANDYNGTYPPDLDYLINEGTITSQQLVVPMSGNQPPACDFYYAAGLSADDPYNWFVAWEDPNTNLGEGANVLYPDGSVSFEKTAPAGTFAKQLQQFLSEYSAKHGQPPEIIPPQ